ncbi:MAG: hypothetical protein CMJ30_03950 [Phycisphaerae bacterium]|nr:hypothetical protein [Phycisphaerae bacterium]
MAFRCSHCLIVCSLAVPNVACADHPSWNFLGYWDLQDRLGAATPTGAGVVIGQVEAGSGQQYLPNPNEAQFDNLIITPMSGAGTTLSHANTVGKYNYGSDWSIAPGIPETKVWNAVDYVQGGFLRVTSGSPLANPGCQVINQSWLGSFGNVSLERETLRRQDYQIVRDGVLSIVGMPNGGGSLSSTLMWAGWNSIAVGTRDESHVSGETSSSTDGAGRQKPFMVAPGSLVSWSAPMVTASVALLLETVETDPILSADPDATSPEVLKAILGASASHTRLGGVNWSNDPVASGPDRGLSTKPLDPVVGTGNCNIDRAHQVMTGGRFDGEIAPFGPAAPSRGWGSVPLSFGQSQWFRFDLSETADTFSFLTTWNRDVRVGFSQVFAPDLTVTMFRVVDGVLAPMLGEAGAAFYSAGNVGSDAPVDNVEHLYIEDLAAGTYWVQITRQDTTPTEPSAWPFAVAWVHPEFTPNFDPADINQDGAVDFQDLLLLLGDYGAPGGPSDVNGDGTVDFQDLVALLAVWS